MSYQPIWRDGQEVTGGERRCDDRYDAIRPLIFDADTVLDVGAHTGYFARRAAWDFPVRVTAVDDHPELEPGGRVDVIPRRLTPADLAALPRHDVVLALSVLHHFTGWRAALHELRACRRWLIVEVPHPDESWMRRAAARHELGSLHDEVSSLAVDLLGRFERCAAGQTFMRPMYLIKGTVTTIQGELFTGSGSNSRSLAKYADGRLYDALGYQPYPGSLNLRVGDAELGEPAVRWRRHVGHRQRAYDAWRAWYGTQPGHVMTPTAKRGHPGAVEGWAPVRLRDVLQIDDGDLVTVDVERGR